jgi:hypothetical protein
LETSHAILLPTRAALAYHIPEKRKLQVLYPVEVSLEADDFSGNKHWAKEAGFVTL